MVYVAAAKGEKSERKRGERHEKAAESEVRIKKRGCQARILGSCQTEKPGQVPVMDEGRQGNCGAAGSAGRGREEFGRRNREIRSGHVLAAT